MHEDGEGCLSNFRLLNYTTATLLIKREFHLELMKPIIAGSTTVFFS